MAEHVEAYPLSGEAVEDENVAVFAIAPIGRHCLRGLLIDDGRSGDRNRLDLDPVAEQLRQMFRRQSAMAAWLSM